MQFVFPTSGIRRYQFPTHINDLVLDRADAATSEVFFVVIGPGKAPPLHKHDDMEQIFYVLKGAGILSISGKRKKYPVKAGDVVRIPPRALHSIQCAGKYPLVYLAIDCFLAGRPKSEPTWDAHARAICKQNGWDYAVCVKGRKKRPI
ncbi:MAG: cupin domain-containing protein [Limisphaerales bacterium]